MSISRGKDIECLDFLRSMVETSYTKRNREKCRTGGSWRSSVYRVASCKASHLEQKYLNNNEYLCRPDVVLDTLVVASELFRQQRCRKAILES